jgi:hypothetical protein
MTITLPPELKAELEALTPTTPVSIVSEPTDISEVTVDDSVIDVSEIEDPLDAEFLQKVGHEILLVDAKADFVIKKVVNEIKARASLTKGKFIHEVQVRFGSIDDELPSKPGLIRYWYSLGFYDSGWDKKFKLPKPATYTAYSCLVNWSRAYRSTLEFQDIFCGLVEDPTAILAATDGVLTKLQSLPLTHRVEVMAEIAEGSVPSLADIKKLTDSPEVKKTLAEEALEKAKQRKAEAQAKFDAVKADPDISSTDPEYNQAAKNLHSAAKSEAKYTQRIAQLEDELTVIKAERIQEARALEEAKQKEAKAIDEAKAAEAALAALESDDDATRRRRIAALSQSLTASVPDVLSDLQKYFAERDYYEISTRESIEDAARALSVFLSMRLTHEPDATPKRKASSSQSSNRHSSQQPEDSGASA